MYIYIYIQFFVDVYLHACFIKLFSPTHMFLMFFVKIYLRSFNFKNHVCACVCKYKNMDVYLHHACMRMPARCHAHLF